MGHFERRLSFVVFTFISKLKRIRVGFACAQGFLLDLILIVFNWGCGGVNKNYGYVNYVQEILNNLKGILFFDQLSGLAE